MHTAIGYLLVLALLGTALANILFNRLIHVSSPVFAASVTYLIPLVAILWGVFDGEHINLYQIIGGLIILLRGLAGQQKETLTLLFLSNKV